MKFCRSRRLFVALTALLAFAGNAGIASAQHPDKLDRALRDGKQSGQAQRVILKATSGYEAWARQLLASKGKKIDAELPSIGAFAVEMTAPFVAEYAARRFSPTMREV